MMRHLSAFVKPGAKYIPLYGAWAANTMAFERSDGSRCLIAVNPQEREMVLNFKGIEFTLPPRSINTISE